jgi:predicted site-specific integrase-resolvase
MDKEYQDLQFAENEFYRAYSLALKAAGSNKGTISRVEKIRSESDLKESEIYAELQDGIKAANARVSQPTTRDDLERERDDRTEVAIELLRKQYANKKTAVFEAATIKLRAIALGR